AILPAILANCQVQSKLLQLKALFAEHERLGADLPSPDARFQRLPVVAPCGRSGLPASHPIRYSSDANTIDLVSAPSNAKEAFSKPGWKRIVGSIQDDAPALTFHKNVTEMEAANEAMDWVGLIHADGNGLGRLFLNFDVHVGRDEPARAYIERYRNFSRALDDCTRKAFAGALAALDARRGAESGKPLPVVPMVLGGDDLTALCDGTMAVRLAADYVTRFMDETAANEHIQKVWKGPLGVCAGVALVKPHYPHHAAYELACDLLESAKGGKRVFRRGDDILPFAALDVHVHLDSSGDDLGLVRERLRSRDGEAALTVRPFVVRAPDDADLDVRARDWAKVRGWDWLERVMPVMPRGGGDLDREARLPNSVLHDLCAAAQDGMDVANARLRAVLGREHKDAPSRVKDAWARLLDSTDPRTASLFVRLPDDGPDKPEHTARLPDALDLMDFWR
ncbi:Cas10/Cmr2 second palm domain-containing protein, partial [Azospirillum brasilense]|uniref:Cas10/Cmr2 second palm domain-containing protein n=1 Tax=Azospirillum brasilense TaxID=192 RepID=UPI001963FB82